MQRHEFSVVLDAPPHEVWDVFWYREADRPQPRDAKTRIDILHPGDDVGNGLVRHCTFAVPRYLLSGGIGHSWEWLTEVEPYRSWRYDAVGKPLWSRATGWTRLVELDDGRTRGQLYDTGRGYPAAVFADPDAEIAGFVLTLAEPEHALADLDRFEGDEYERVEVRTTDGTAVLAYDWRGEMAGLRPIAAGTWPN